MQRTLTDLIMPQKNIDLRDNLPNPEIHDLGEHILQFDHVFHPVMCDEIIDIFEEADRAGYTMGRENTATDIRDTAISTTNLLPSQLPKLQEIQDIFQEEIIPEFLKKYPIQNQYNHIAMGGAKIQRTNPSEGYHVWHMEKWWGHDGTLCAWALFLNDVEEGGELEFLYQSVRVNPERGKFVLWPAGYTHMHRGNPPLKGTKYILTGWIDTL